MVGGGGREGKKGDKAKSGRGRNKNGERRIWQLCRK